MNGITVTRFENTDDSKKMAKQIAESVNKIERILQNTPIYFGTSDPNGNVVGQSGSLYIRTGDQGYNQEIGKAFLYIKTIDGTNTGWLSLLFLGAQNQNSVTASRGSLYIKIPTDLASSANIYLKQSNDSTPSGWSVL
ncbi:MAG: hypothetical protein SFW66_08880 [Gammaproteobacteria bacterium]|nr:hypothetical protein [Gammaproteobacteria bacterium]